jgi:hypothetical protein
MQTHTPPLVFVGLLAASLLVRCGGQVDSGSTRGRATSQEAGVGSGGRSAMTGGAAGSAQGAGGVGTGGITAAGGVLVVPYVPDTGAPQPPFVSPDHCTTAEQCSFPHSTCEDSATLAYFTDPVCSGGVCEWNRRTMTCGRGCEAGGCLPTVTASIGPGLIPGAPCADNVDAGGCALPSSICANGFQLLYFDEPHCSEGSCAYTTHVQDCQYGCYNGSCDVLHAH